MSKEDDYEKYMRILNVVFRTCATMLAIVFAYTLGAGYIPLTVQVFVTMLVLFLTVTFLLSGLGIILGRRSEPGTLKSLALFSFFMMIGLVIGMLVLLIYAIYG